MAMCYKFNLVTYVQGPLVIDRRGGTERNLTLNLLTTTIVAPPSNANKWQMGFNSAFKGLNEVTAGSR